MPMTWWQLPALHQYFFTAQIAFILIVIVVPYPLLQVLIIQLVIQISAWLTQVHLAEQAAPTSSLLTALITFSRPLGLILIRVDIISKILDLASIQSMPKTTQAILLSLPHRWSNSVISLLLS